MACSFHEASAEHTGLDNRDRERSSRYVNLQPDITSTREVKGCRDSGLLERSATFIFSLPSAGG
jgi:hypothetical protein